jgi:glycosyltransferase involved in cell wall biosynthesis
MWRGSRGRRVVDHVPRRVAFTHLSRRLWAGGYNYQSNLFVALNRYCPGAITPVLFAGEDDAADEVAALAGIPGVEVVRSGAFDRRKAALVSALTLGMDRPAVTAFRAARIDVVFEVARFFGWRLPFPAVAWFPDFQHRRLPQLFPRTARWRRDLGFRTQLVSGRSVLLSSNSALRDLRESYPNLTNDVSVVQFASEPPTSLLAADPLAVLAQYGLPSKFVYLPNHLWRHKNHQIVLDALTLLKQRGVEIVVVASGGVEDPREPDHFASIEQRIKTRGLEANFRHVGMIPLAHVYALLRSAAALLNPSKFEGWSTTVEEAKSFGVPMVLSDIDVHFEQTHGQARYFGVDDAETLARHLANVWIESGPAIVRDLLPNVEARVSSFAQDFVRLIRDAGTPRAPNGGVPEPV